MARRRTIRNRRNRPRTSRVGRSINQVSNGIPRTIKRIRGDPPPINLASTQTVKIPFYLDVNLAATKAPFQVLVASSPVGKNFISLFTTDFQTTMTCYLDQDEVFQAACVRVFGSIPGSADINYLSTEFALQSVTFYGPLGTSLIRMGVDFGPGLPGTTSADSGTLTSRPVVKSTATRLYWSKLEQIKAGDAAIGLWVEDYLPPGRSLEYKTSGVHDGFQYRSVGRIDCVVHVRRSWYSANTASSLTAKAVTDAQMG